MKKILLGFALALGMSGAAVAAGGLGDFPEWPPGAPADLTEYNDLASWSRANEHD